MKTIIKANDILNVLRSWIGYSEMDGRFKEILDIYNTHKPLARGYIIKPTDEWCDATVSAAAIKAGAVDLIGTEVSCEEHIKIFKEKGIWIEDGSIIPEPGYIIVFNWDENLQPNNGRADHIGYVEQVNNNAILCIEGNKGGKVDRRAIPLGWGFIRGFASPKYALEKTNIESEDKNMDGKEMLNKINEHLATLQTSEYAKESSQKAIKSGIFADGNKDGLIDNPQGLVTREQLAIILNRAGLFDK